MARRGGGGGPRRRAAEQRRVLGLTMPRSSRPATSVRPREEPATRPEATGVPAVRLWRAREQQRLPITSCKLSETGRPDCRPSKAQACKCHRGAPRQMTPMAHPCALTHSSIDHDAAVHLRRAARRLCGGCALACLRRRLQPARRPPAARAQSSDNLVPCIAARLAPRPTRRRRRRRRSRPASAACRRGAPRLCRPAAAGARALRPPPADRGGSQEGRRRQEGRRAEEGARLAGGAAQAGAAVDAGARGCGAQKAGRQLLVPACNATMPVVCLLACTLVCGRPGRRAAGHGRPAAGCAECVARPGAARGAQAGEPSLCLWVLQARTIVDNLLPANQEPIVVAVPARVPVPMPADPGDHGQPAVCEPRTDRGCFAFRKNFFFSIPTPIPTPCRPR